MNALALLLVVGLAAPLTSALALAVHSAERPAEPPPVARAAADVDEADGLCESCRLRPATVVQVAAGETFAVCRGCAVREVQS